VSLSVHTTVILHTLWHGWPLHKGDPGRLISFVVGAFVSLGLLGSSLRVLRRDEVLDRAWRERWPESLQPLGDG
jgi:hypothetical protein